jgi:hypothetical protein
VRRRRVISVSPRAVSLTGSPWSGRGKWRSGRSRGRLTPCPEIARQPELVELVALDDPDGHPVDRGRIVNRP